MNKDNQITKLSIPRGEVEKTKRGEYNVDEPFDEIVLEKIKPEIAKAFILLESILRWRTIMPIGQETRKLAQKVQEKADQMKKEINSFIDTQVKMITDGIESRAKTDFQVFGSQEGKQSLP